MKRSDYEGYEMIRTCCKLLPALAAAHDLSTVEKRAAWMIAQRQGERIGYDAKFGAATALARLELNPDDAEVIDRIAHFYDRVPAGSNGEQFSYPGVAWVLGKYWDRFTPAQRDHLKSRIKGFNDLLGHGTENHALMKCVAAYLFAQYWPNDTGWVRGTKTSAEVMETARGRLLSVIKSLYDKSYEENLSHNYAPVHLFPYYALYDCATDPEIKTAADAALHFHLANMAANHFEGVTIPPANRDYPGTTWNTYTIEPGKRHASHLIHWFYWADAQNWAPAEIDREDGNYVIYAALSSWRPPAAIGSLARGETVPYELTASAPSFGHAGVSPGAWGTGMPAECVRYVYRDKLYAMGSGFFQYYPEEYYVDYTAFRLIYKSPDKYNFIECYHPYWRSDNREWRGLNSPFMQTAQHKGAAIHLFNIPATDPWKGRSRRDWLPSRDGHYNNLIKEALIRYPKSIDQKAESNGWIFLREGDVYIAIRPLKNYTIDANYKPAGKDFNVVRSAFAQTAIVFDIATKQEFATFEAFQTAAAANPPVVDWERLSVTYKNVRGDTLTAAWNPPKYDVPKGKRVLVRPDITVNGAVVPIDRDFIKGKAVMKSPSVQLVNRVLRLKTSAGNLEVDWRGKAPRFSSRSGSSGATPAAPKPKAPPADPAAQKEILAACDRQLLARVKRRLAVGKAVSVNIKGLGAGFWIKALDADGNLQLQRDTLKTTKKWADLTLSERRLVAEGLLVEGVEEDHALVAGYLLAEKRRDLAMIHLSKAGPSAEKLLEAFK